MEEVVVVVNGGRNYRHTSFMIIMDKRHYAFLIRTGNRVSTIGDGVKI